MKRKDFLKSIGMGSIASSLTISSLFNKSKVGSLASPPVCTLAPAETFGPFPSLPSGDTMYWRSNITDGQSGVPFTFTMRVNGTDNCGVLEGYRVDVWHCNADAFYSHYATGGANNGHQGQNTPANNQNLIYCRGSQVTNANGEVTFTSIFPGWYNGRTCHIHFAVYSGGTPGSNNGWVLENISQYTFPIVVKNELYQNHSPYSNYGVDPLHPDNDNVFSAPAGEWEELQLGSLIDNEDGTYSSYYETAVEGLGVLPLDLIGFNGSVNNENGLLWWKTENEQNFSHFELEYGADGEDFEYLATIKAKGEGASSTNNYVYEDTGRLIHGNVYYRLKMIDNDGQFRYSAVVGLKYEAAIPLKIYPVPAVDHILLQHPMSNGSEKVLVLDGVGKPIGVGYISDNTTLTSIDLNLCSAGVHYLVYSSAYDSQTIKFLITK